MPPKRPSASEVASSYLISRGAYEALERIQQHLSLLACLAEARSEQHERLFITPDSLAHLFSKIGADLDEVLMDATAQS